MSEWQQFLQNLPDTWNPKPLKRFLALNDSGVWGEEGTDEDGTPVLRSTDITVAGDWAIDDPAVRMLNSSEKRAARLLEGDLLVVKSSGSELHLGKTALVDSHVAKLGACFSNFTQRLRPGSGDSRFIWYLLNSHFGREQLVWLGSTTTGLRNLNGEILGQVLHPGPPTSEQGSIADLLDRETARVDQISKMKQSLIDRIQERRTTLVANALPGLGDVRFGGEGVPYVMTEWPLVRLGHVATVQTGMTLDAGRATADEEVELPYLRVANVQDGWVDLEEVKDVVVPRSIADSSRLAPGDVLMTEGGDPDKLGRGTVWKGQIEECLHQNHIFAVRPSPDRLLSSYLALLTRTPLARTYFEVTASKTTGIASTSSGKIRSWRIPLPSVEEQEQAVKRVSERERILVEAIEGLQKQLDGLAERRQSLITAAVTGQLDVRRHVGAA